MLLRHFEYRGESTYPLILDLAAAALTNDPHGERAEFIDLVKRAQELDTRN